MCGISGHFAVGSKVREDFAVAVKKMTKALHHRGPDDAQIWMNHELGIAFGHARLAIIDLTESGSQPMTDSTGRYVITFNGEIYNYRALRTRLESLGTKFKGTSDTEVLLNGIVHFGIFDFLCVVHGMFAVAVFDKQERKLFLARDLAGEKPLYYTQSEAEGFLFASELDALAKGLKSSPTLSLSALQMYLTFRYVPQPFSIYKSCFKLRPGHILEVRQDGSISEYPFSDFSLEFAQGKRSPTFDDALNQTRELLLRSLSDTVSSSDVPVGLFLSGGVDSSLTAILLSRYLNRTPKSYSVRFVGQPNDESGIARTTSKKLGLPFTEIAFDSSDIVGLLPRVVSAMDEPMGDRSCIPTFVLAEHTARDVKVALGGDGGDELFGGYGRYSELSSRLSWTHGLGAKAILAAYLNEPLKVFGLSEVTVLFNNLTEPFKLLLDRLAMPFLAIAPLEQSVRFVDFHSYLPGAVLSKVDRMAMAHSLEVRTPFFNPALLQFAATLSLDNLKRSGESKPLLRVLLAKEGFGELAKRPKQGFGMPPGTAFGMDSKTLSGMVGSAVSVLTESGPTKHIFSDRERLLKYARANANALWATIVLGHWINKRLS